jgi:hypothetical protein
LLHCPLEQSPPQEIAPGRFDDDVQALTGIRLFRGDYQEPFSNVVHREIAS